MLHNLSERRRLLVLALALCSLCGASYSQTPKSGAPPKTASPITTAKTQMERGDLASAETTLWGILSTQPANEQALTMLGVVRGRQKRYAEAEALFRRVLQLNPKSTVASRNLASALLAQDKADDALREYHHTIQLSPQDTDLRIEVAKLELSRGNFAGALSTLEAIKPERFPPSAIAIQAASLLGVNRRSDAFALIPRVKGSPGPALDLARVFVEAKELDAALKTLSLVTPASKAVSAQVDYLKGRALRQRGDTVGAMASFNRALAANPKSAETAVAMAEIFAADNKHAQSFAMLEKARAASPGSVEVLRHLVVEAMKAGQNEKGLQAAQELQSKSSDLDDRYLVATVMLQQRHYQPATRILEDYVSQRPQDARAYLGLGMGYLSLLRYAEARQALERSVQIDPSLAEAEHQLGMLASQQGNREEAMQHWQRAVALQPNHAAALFSMGTMYLESGELSEALSAFSRSLSADPRNMKTEYNLGLVLNKLGRTEEARQHLDRYKKMQWEEHVSRGKAIDQ